MRRLLRARHAAARVAPARGPGRLEYLSRGGAPASATTEAGIPSGPILNPAVKPAFAESTAARGCAGGQGVAASPRRFASDRRAPREAIAGRSPCGLFRVLGARLMKAPFRVPGARPTAAHARHPPIAVPGACPEGRPCRAVPSFGRCAPARFCAVCAPCNQSWCFRWLSLRGGLVGGRLSFVMRRFPIQIFVGH